MNAVDLLWQILTDPNIVYLLLIAGIWCVALAFTTPGLGLPEAGAAVFLCLALLGLSRLPVNAFGLVLIFLSLALYVVELKATNHGAFGLAGIVTLAVGSFFLFRVDESTTQVSLIVIGLTVLVTGGFFAFALRKALEIRLKPPFQNPDAVVGMVGEAKTDILKEGAVQVGDELWTAEAAELIPSGTKVQIVRRSGLRLTVARLKS
jgi:membrane-bound serine protease (ClpP class)